MTFPLCPWAGNFEIFGRGLANEQYGGIPLPRLTQVKVKLQDLSGAFPVHPGNLVVPAPLHS